MDSSCSVLLIAVVTDMGDVGVKVAREVVEEAHSTHRMCERAASRDQRSSSAITRRLFPHPRMAPHLCSFMNTVPLYLPKE